MQVNVGMRQPDLRDFVALFLENQTIISNSVLSSKQANKSMKIENGVGRFPRCRHLRGTN